MLKVSVIGGSGFVGTYLCKRLYEEKIPFEILDIKTSKSFPEQTKFSDVRVLDSLRETVTGNIIINLAAIHRDDVKDKKKYEDTNVVGARNIVQFCNEQSIRKVIFTSSVAVYGSSNKVINEDGVVNPKNEYGKSKFQAEQIFTQWQKNGNNSLIIVRPTVIFGLGNRGNVYNLFQQVKQNYFVMIGKGENKKSMAYVKNVADFLVSTIFYETDNMVFNYVDGPNLSMKELVKLVSNKLGKRNWIRFTLPFKFGLLLGYFADVISFFIKKKTSY